MIAQKTYWIQTKMSRSFTTMDPEEHEALVSIMRNLSRFCGINILTYRIESAKITILVSCPARDNHLKFFEDADNEPPGSGLNRLFMHLRNQYSSAHLDDLADEIEALEHQGESIQPIIEHYTRRIGIPKKFAEGVNEAFTRWVKKNRPQMYEDLHGNVCRKGITQTLIDQLQKRRDIATHMDRDAVINDDGTEPRTYWCGYADALRGDEDALDGLRELMRSSASNAEEIKDLGYCRKPVRTESGKTLPRARPSRKKRPTVRTGEGSASRVQSNWLGDTKEPEVAKKVEAYEWSGKLLKLGFIGMLLTASAVGAFVIGKDRRESQAQESNTGNEIQMEAVAEAQQQSLKAKDLELADMTSLLYKEEARQMAVDFVKTSDPEIRLKMCRDPENVRKRLESYPPQAVNEIAKDVIFMDVVDLRVIMAARFYVKFADDTKRLLCIVPTPEGLRVDWDCYARYNTEAWPKLLDGTVKSAEFRVFARRSDYHAFEYRDETQWVCFELLSPDFDDVLYAYAARGTTTAKLLEAAVPYTEDAKVVQLTLQLSSPGEGYQHKQFTIDRLYATGWVRGERDIEDDYREKIHELGQVGNK